MTKDAIVVLGAAVWQGGIPSPSLIRRIVHGIKLFQRGESDILILTGGIGKFPPSEAYIMEQICLEQGINKNQIILDEEAHSTLENAINCSKILKTNNWSTALIVSDRYHLLRAIFLFRQLDIHAEGSSPDYEVYGTSKRRWYYLHLREALAIPWSIFQIYVFRINLFIHSFLAN